MRTHKKHKTSHQHSSKYIETTLTAENISNFLLFQFPLEYIRIICQVICHHHI